MNDPTNWNAEPLDSNEVARIGQNIRDKFGLHSREAAMYAMLALNSRAPIAAAPVNASNNIPGVPAVAPSAAPVDHRNIYLPRCPHGFARGGGNECPECHATPPAQGEAEEAAKLCDLRAHDADVFVSSAITDPHSRASAARDAELYRLAARALRQPVRGEVTEGARVLLTEMLNDPAMLPYWRNHPSTHAALAAALKGDE